MAFLTNLMRDILLYFYNATGNFGIAIILLTILTRVVLLPLYINQTKTTAKMKELQPLMKELQVTYKDNPQEQQKQMMELYKRHKYNPFAGCLPLIVQLPFIYAVFGALRAFPAGIAAEAFTRPFVSTFLIWDLVAKDPTYILPVLSGATTYWSMTQTNSDPSQKTMMILMPIFLIWVSTTFSAGLVLYWVVGNLLSVAQQYWFIRKTAAKRGGSEA